jgi:hypothetical protein
MNVARTADRLILASLCLMCICASMLICSYECQADISRTAPLALGALVRSLSRSERFRCWLGETDDGNLKALLVPYPADQMRMWEISPRVNSPKNDDPSLWEPLHAEATKTTTDALELLPGVDRSFSAARFHQVRTGSLIAQYGRATGSIQTATTVRLHLWSAAPEASSMWRINASCVHPAVSDF